MNADAIVVRDDHGARTGCRIAEHDEGAVRRAVHQPHRGLEHHPPVEVVEVPKPLPVPGQMKALPSAEEAKPAPDSPRPRYPTSGCLAS